MFDIAKLRDIRDVNIACFGNHPGIIQSMIDFDYMAGKSGPSVVAIIGTPQKNFRYFWGDREVLVKGYRTIDDMPASLRRSIHLFTIMQSARRVQDSVTQATEKFPNVLGGTIFAEGVPEQHSLKIRKLAAAKGIFIFGPASVGLTVSGQFKLGAIGGTTAEGIAATGLVDKGGVAVVSSSGGMVNEVINMVAQNGYRVSFAAAVGGERYPVTTPLEVLKAALQDRATKALLYFGELGGRDEYDIAEYISRHGIKKPIICYIAGKVAEYFEVPPQFGHAKALAGNDSETASAKKAVLKSAGATVADSFIGFEKQLNKLTLAKKTSPLVRVGELAAMQGRRPALFVNRVSSDRGEDVKLLGTSLLETVDNNTVSSLALGLMLGHPARSKQLVAFFDYAMKLLVDHGPQVSGAVNTMITARAGKDLASSLAAGILTIGPRFGGAINQAAQNWLTAVSSKENPYDFVERFAKSNQYIPGIGHKKYRIDNPDPRVKVLCERFDAGGSHLKFARQIEAITVDKKAQLILNVDGAIAALTLDILQLKEKMDLSDIQGLIDSEFFNAIFILSRSIGFTAHFMEQKRLDEGLFRLPDDLISSL